LVRSHDLARAQHICASVSGVIHAQASWAKTT
jgi:hypothetical protein